MNLTQAQLATLRADILADPVLSTVPHTPDGDVQIATAYNQTASPIFVVWRTDIARAEVVAATVLSDYLALTSQNAAAWTFYTQAEPIDASQQNIRAAVGGIFPGASTTTANMVLLAKRNCTRVEKLYATGTGTTATPGLLVFIGPLSASDVNAARAN